MDNTLLQFVNEFGYLAVFVLVFLQEIGVPNPIPNELVLLFAGALTTIGNLSYWLMLGTVIAADVSGTVVLFSVFYFFEKVIMERIPKWIPINENLDRLKGMILRRGKWAIFLGRLMPYVRGYVSVAAGVLNLPYRVFVPIVCVSAVLWSGGYVTLGHFLGRQWERVADTILGYQWIVLGTLVVAIASIIAWKWYRRRKRAQLDNTA